VPNRALNHRQQKFGLPMMNPRVNRSCHPYLCPKVVIDNISLTTILTKPWITPRYGTNRTGGNIALHGTQQIGAPTKSLPVDGRGLQNKLDRLKVDLV